MKESYQQYLASPDWKSKRSEKLNRKAGNKKRCAICGSTEHLDVHHLIYRARLEDAQQTDLRILCRLCHDTAHRLQRDGKIVFKSESHHHRFAVTQNAVKRELGIPFTLPSFPPTRRPISDH